MQWRDEATFLTFNTVDQLFVTYRLLTYTHECFKEIQIFPAHTMNIPDGLEKDRFHPTLEGPYYSANHGDGFEGLRQKAWTLVTTAMVLEVSTG